MVATEIADLANFGVQVTVVVGGGNIFRGESARRMDRATGDYVGMLATAMNAVTLQALGVRGRSDGEAAAGFLRLNPRATRRAAGVTI